MMISLAMYPVLHKINPSLAVGYVGLRFLEGFIFVINAVLLLILVTLSKDFTDLNFTVYDNLDSVIECYMTLDGSLIANFDMINNTNNGT